MTSFTWQTYIILSLISLGAIALHAIVMALVIGASINFGLKKYFSMKEEYIDKHIKSNEEYEMFSAVQGRRPS